MQVETTPDAPFFHGYVRRTANVMRQLRKDGLIRARRSQRGPVRRVQPAGRIICAVERDGRELQYHTTKGWRSYRA